MSSRPFQKILIDGKLVASGDAANMSLGGPPSAALDFAVLIAAEAGINFSLAAGNSGKDANNSSPAISFIRYR